MSDQAKLLSTFTKQSTATHGTEQLESAGYTTRINFCRILKLFKQPVTRLEALVDSCYVCPGGDNEIRSFSLYFRRLQSDAKFKVPGICAARRWISSGYLNTEGTR